MARVQKPLRSPDNQAHKRDTYYLAKNTRHISCLTHLTENHKNKHHNPKIALAMYMYVCSEAKSMSGHLDFIIFPSMVVVK